MDGGALVGVGKLNGNGIAQMKTLTLSAGKHSLRAVYGGTGTFRPSQSGPVDSVVNAVPGGTFGFNPFLTSTVEQPGATSVAIGDFNGDGKADLAVGAGTGGLDVLLGNGDGTFKLAVKYAAGLAAWVAVGDFNNDGLSDLAVANGSLSNPSVSVLLGNGDGTFQAAVGVPTGTPTQFVSVGDFNGDGFADLAAINSDVANNGISVLLGNGDGTFQAAVRYIVGSGPGALTIADFNGDGAPDLVVANTNSNDVSLLLGNGDGTFQAATSIAAGVSPSFITSGDFDRDGKVDLAVTILGSSPANAVSVLLGNGDGTFQSPVNYPSGGGQASVADFDGDGKSDLVVRVSNHFAVLFGNGNGSFQAPIPVGPSPSIPLQATSMAVGDFNGDGRADVAVGNSSPVRNVTVFLGALPLNGPAISTSVLPTATIGVAYGPVQLAATGGTGIYTWSATGLPTGLSLSTGGLLSGTPAAGSQGSYSPLIKVKDSNNASGDRSLSILVVPPGLNITGPSSLPRATVGVLYAPVQFSAFGGTGGYTWSADLPNGLTFSAGGVLSGTPAPGSQGSYNPMFSVRDSQGNGAVVTLPLIVRSAAPTITSVNPNPVPAADVNQTFTINGSGFQSDTVVQLNKGHSGSSNSSFYPQVTFISSTQLQVSFNFGATGSDWSVLVINSDGQGSNFFLFFVTIPPAVTSFALPQLAFGGGWYTALYFSNPLEFPVTVVVSFMANDGSPLPVPLAGIGAVSSRTMNLDPFSTVILEAPNTGNLVQGWAEASLPQGVVGYAVFRQSVPGRADQEAVVLLTPESSQMADLVYDDTALTTSVAFVNPSNQEVTVSVTAHGTDGSQIGTSQVTLTARSKQALILKSLDGLSGVTGKRGWATFSVSNGAVSVMGFRSGTEAFTTIPVAHGTSVPATSALPQLAYGGGWYTALYFANTTGSTLSTTVSFVGNDGAPLSVPIAGIGSVSSQTLSVSPGATMILEAPNIGDLVQGWAEAIVPQGMVGYAVFRQSVSGRADQEAVVPLTRESSRTANLIYDDTLLTTSIAVLNPSSQPTAVSIVAYGQGAAVLGTAEVILGAREKQALVLNSIPGLSNVAGSRGLLFLSVLNGDVSALGLRSGEQAFTSIPVN